MAVQPPRLWFDAGSGKWFGLVADRRLRTVGYFDTRAAAEDAAERVKYELNRQAVRVAKAEEAELNEPLDARARGRRGLCEPVMTHENQYEPSPHYFSGAQVRSPCGRVESHPHRELLGAPEIADQGG
jgi:hypothetical protein